MHVIYQELQKRLEGYCNDMRRFQYASDDIQNWLDTNTRKQQELRNTSGSREEVENRLTRTRVSREETINNHNFDTLYDHI